MTVQKSTRRESGCETDWPYWLTVVVFVIWIVAAAAVPFTFVVSGSSVSLQKVFLTTVGVGILGLIAFLLSLVVYSIRMSSR
jgi:hypothetical protein